MSLNFLQQFLPMLAVIFLPSCIFLFGVWHGRKEMKNIQNNDLLRSLQESNKRNAIYDSTDLNNKRNWLHSDARKKLRNAKL